MIIQVRLNSFNPFLIGGTSATTLRHKNYTSLKKTKGSVSQRSLHSNDSAAKDQTKATKPHTNP